MKQTTRICPACGAIADIGKRHGCGYVVPGPGEDDPEYFKTCDCGMVHPVGSCCRKCRRGNEKDS